MKDSTDQAVREESRKLADAIDRDVLNTYLPPERRLPSLWGALRTTVSADE